MVHCIATDTPSSSILYVSSKSICFPFVFLFRAIRGKPLKDLAVVTRRVLRYTATSKDLLAEFVYEGCLETFPQITLFVWFLTEISVTGFTFTGLLFVNYSILRSLRLLFRSGNALKKENKLKKARSLIADAALEQQQMGGVLSQGYADGNDGDDVTESTQFVAEHSEDAEKKSLVPAPAQKQVGTVPQGCSGGNDGDDVIESTKFVAKIMPKVVDHSEDEKKNPTCART